MAGSGTTTTLPFVVVYNKQRVTRFYYDSSKGKGLHQQAKMAQGVPGRLRCRIFLTFGTKRVVGRQLYAPAAFIP